jgi:hypothetical protein
MKPLIIIQFDTEVERNNVQMFEDYIEKITKPGGVMEEYKFLVIHGDLKITVHYPHKPISYYFNKIKAWVFLKIWKKKRFSNTSVII